MTARSVRDARRERRVEGGAARATHEGAGRGAWRGRMERHCRRGDVEWGRVNGCFESGSGSASGSG